MFGSFTTGDTKRIEVNALELASNQRLALAAFCMSLQKSSLVFIFKNFA